MLTVEETGKLPEENLNHVGAVLRALPCVMRCALLIDRSKRQTRAHRPDDTDAGYVSCLPRPRRLT